MNRFIFGHGITIYYVIILKSEQCGFTIIDYRVTPPKDAVRMANSEQ